MFRSQRPALVIGALCAALFLSACSDATPPAPSASSPTLSKQDEQRRALGRLDREDKAAAAALAQQLSDSGDPMAMAYLGALHLDGTVVPKDRKKAEGLFERASSLGDAETDFLIGKTFAHCRCEGNKEAAFSWYSRAAARGNLNATFDLGGMHELGFGVKQNPTKAFAEFLKAAKLGHPGAMLKLAEYYANGTGVKKDEALSQQWRANASAAAIKQSLPK